MKYQSYPEYKDSNLKWVGKFPKHWEKRKVKHLFKTSKEKSFEKNPTILSLTLKGIIKRDISSNEGQIAASYDGYHKIRKGDIVMNPMDLISGFVDCAKIEGVISPAYNTLRPIKDLNPEFYNYYFQKHYYEKIFFPFAEGVSTEYRWTLKNEDLMNFYAIEPPLDEQIKISTFLDSELAKIDQIIRKYEHIIEIIKEKRIGIISHVVTKGLDQDVEMKDSGVEWIGEIPEYWDVKKLKYIARFFYGSSLSDENRKSEGNIKVYGSNGVVRTHDTGITRGETLIIGRKGSFGEVNWSPDSCFPIDTTYFIDKNATKVYLRWLYYLLKALKLNQISRDSAIPGLSREEAYNRPAPYTQLNQQEKIANYLDKKTSEIDFLIKKIESQITLLKEYKISLISHAVTGKIDVRKQSSK